MLKEKFKVELRRATFHDFKKIQGSSFICKTATRSTQSTHNTQDTQDAHRCSQMLNSVETSKSGGDWSCNLVLVNLNPIQL